MGWGSGGRRRRCCRCCCRGRLLFHLLMGRAGGGEGGDECPSQQSDFIMLPCVPARAVRPKITTWKGSSGLLERHARRRRGRGSFILSMHYYRDSIRAALILLLHGLGYIVMPLRVVNNSDPSPTCNSVKIDRGQDKLHSQRTRLDLIGFSRNCPRVGRRAQKRHSKPVLCGALL